MLIRFNVQEQERSSVLKGQRVQVGRGADNDLVLPDFSVSRKHAEFQEQDGEWWIQDLSSTNGILLNGTRVERAQLSAGDELKIGIFELRVDDHAAADVAVVQAMTHASIVRSRADFSRPGIDTYNSELFGLEPTSESPGPVEATKVRPDLFAKLHGLSRQLLEARTVEEVLNRVVETAFDSLSIDRAFVLLGSIESAHCEISRVGDETVLRPERSAVPVSKTILEAVLTQEVALLTMDALEDQRLAGGESIRIHGIRAAMCAPLWSDEGISGFMQVDTLIDATQFVERDLDFLIALANYAAIGVERIRDRNVRSRLERYHSPAILDEVVAGARSGNDLTHIKRAEVTVLFADLVGFTGFSSVAEPEEVAALLEGYCNRAVEAIFAEDGTLDKFIGDCVMAFFGAPVPQEDHALRGVKAGQRLQQAMVDWNLERTKEGLDPVQCRIAMHSGPVVVGDVGSEQRVDYTVLGNTVNVAARLESGVAKAGDLVIGDVTFDEIQKTSDHGLRFESLGEFQLKGLQGSVTAHRLLGEKS